MLDDILVVVYWKPDETKEELLRRGRRGVVALGQELMGR